MTTGRRIGRRGLVRGLGIGGLLMAAGPILAACAAPVSTGGAAVKSAEVKPAVGVGAAETVVLMNDQNKYVPEMLTIKKGTTVTWRNVGMMPHNIITDPAMAMNKANARVPAGAAVFTSPLINGGGTWSYTFQTPGEYVYFCQPHEALGMVGRLTVTE